MNGIRIHNVSGDIFVCVVLYLKKTHSTLHVIKLRVLVAYIIVHSIISTYIFIYRLFGHVLFDLYGGIYIINQIILILEHIGQSDNTLRRLIPKKTITPVFKISTYIITSMTARPIWLAVILPIMSVSTFKTVVIPYLCFHLQMYAFFLLSY